MADNTKDTVDVPATYLDKANFPGPFTAGVNQVIPYEFFAGDGMLTRLILKASDKAPWSDNGSAKNPALPPVENWAKVSTSTKWTWPVPKVNLIKSF